MAKSEECFRAIFETAQDSIFIKDCELRYVQVNPAMEKLLGLPASELIGKTDAELFGEEAGPHITEIDSRVLSGEIVEDEDAKPVRGSLYAFHVIKAPMRDSSGEIIGLCGIARDITKRKQVEEALRENEEKYRTLFESSVNGIFLMTDVFIDCNEQACRLWACEREDIIGHSPAEFSPPTQPDGSNSSEAARKNIETALAGTPRSFYWKHRRKDGTLMDTGVSLKVLDVGGERVLQVVVRDITDRKQAEETLRKNEYRLRMIMENTSDGINIAEYDPKTNYRRLLMCNDRYVEMSGRSREELMAADDLNIIAREIECYSQSFCEQTLKSLPSMGMSSWIRPDGKENYYEWTATPQEMGDKYHIIGIDRDVTERRHAEKIQRIQHDLAIDISMMSNLAESVDQLLETIFRMESIDCGRVYLVNDRTGDLELVSHKGLSQQFVENASHYSADSPQTRLVMKGEPFYGSYPKFFSSVDEAYKQESLRAFATISVKNEGKVVAALNLASHTHDTIPDSTRDMLEGIAAQIGGVIARVRAEETLEKNEYRLRLIMENASDGINIVEYDPKTNRRQLLMCNDRYVEMSGRSREELMAAEDLNALLVIPSEHRGEPFPEPELKGLSPEGTASWDRPDGKENYYEWSATPLKVGDKYHIIGVARDVTDRRHAEKIQRIQHDLAIDISMASDLTESVDQLLETIFRTESIDCGGVYLVNDRTGDLELVSHKGLSQQFVESALAYSADSPQTCLVMKGEPLYGFYPKIFSDLDEFHKRESLRAFATIPVKYEGKVIAALNLASHTHDVIPDSTRDMLEGIAAQIGGVIARGRAEEEKAELEGQLRQAVKMEAIGRLAGGIAHDFNNMLAIIQGYADLLLKAMDADDQNRDDVERIRVASQRAAALTKQLLAFGRRQTIKPEVLDLNDIISDTDSMLQRIIGEDIELVTKPGKDLWHVKVDPRQIEEQVILNLAVNAREAMPNGGKITISTANIVLDENYTRRHVEVVPGEYVMLVVGDTGTGMTEEIMSHVFEPFFSTKQAGKSSGLGLSTIYGIVKQSGGHIEVESTRGQGSTFRMYLPRVKKPIKSTTSEKGPDQAGRGTETILVAEDEPSVRDLLCRILRETGYTVLVAADGKEAINTATNEGKIHLLVTDVVMPRMSGKELSDQIKAKHSDIKVLFVSGYTNNAISHHGILNKGVNFLAKPFTSAQLTRTVRRVLDTK